MGILTRYLYRQTVLGLLLAFIIIISLVVLVDFVELSRRFGGYDNVHSFTIIRLALLKLPSVAEQTLPFVVLFGVMWAMFRLNRRSELVAMRAAGASAWKFVTPPTIIGGILGVITMTALNPGAAYLQKAYDADVTAISRSASGKKVNLDDRVWLREATANGGTLIVRASYANPAQSLLVNTTFLYYHLDAKGDPIFEQRYDAKTARLADKKWHLQDVVMNRAGGVLPVHSPTVNLPSSLVPGDLLQRLAKPGSFSFWALPRLIHITREANLDSRRYELQWQRLLALPFSLAAMAMIGAASSFRLARLGGAFRMAITGGAIGFVLYFAGDLMQALGASQVLPSAVAIWAPPIFVLLAALARITILEDG